MRCFVKQFDEMRYLMPCLWCLRYRAWILPVVGSRREALESRRGPTLLRVSVCALSLSVLFSNSEADEFAFYRPIVPFARLCRPRRTLRSLRRRSRSNAMPLTTQTYVIGAHIATHQSGQILSLFLALHLAFGTSPNIFCVELLVWQMNRPLLAIALCVEYNCTSS